MYNIVHLCGEKIAFNYVEHLDADKTGITLIACDNLVRANGLAIYNTYKGKNGEINFNRVLVCLPSTISKAVDIRTLNHEIGHALGLDHISPRQSVCSKKHALWKQ